MPATDQRPLASATKPTNQSDIARQTSEKITAGKRKVPVVAVTDGYDGLKVQRAATKFTAHVAEGADIPVWAVTIETWNAKRQALIDEDDAFDPENKAQVQQLDEQCAAELWREIEQREVERAKDAIMAAKKQQGK